MAEPIDFYFDFLSPYGYFASHQIDALAARHGREVNWRVYLVGAAFKLTGQAPAFEQSEIRQRYGLRDVALCARYYGVPFKFPKVFGTSAIPASRAYYWFLDRDPALAKSYAQAVYRCIFAEDIDMRPESAVAQLCDELGQDGAAIAAWAQSPDGKDRFRRETDAAIARGCFGSPFFFVGDQGFWGTDRLPMLEWYVSRGAVTLPTG